MLSFLLLYIVHCQSLWVKNFGTLKSHLDRGASAVGNCHLSQSSAFGKKKNLDIFVLSFTEEVEHIQG